MKVKVIKTIRVDVKTIQVSAGVRCWDDAMINGVRDTENGENIPCKAGERWEPLIDIDSGKILNWHHGKIANIHYKVADDGNYKLLDAEGNTIVNKDSYVPDFLAIDGPGYGDYIKMSVDELGFIIGWDASGIQEWSEEEGF